MPLYEYQCDACGHRFETIRKFSDAPLDACPKCGGALQKLQSAPAFHLKGSGWYVTDYARKEQGAGGGADMDQPSGDKSDNLEKSEKAATSDKADSSAKTEKGEKSDKAEKSAQSDSATTSGSDTASTASAKADTSASASTPSSGSGSSAPTK